MSMTHHNQTKKLTTWFLNLSFDESIDNKRHKVRNSNPRSHKALLEDQRPRKAQECHVQEGKAARPTKVTKSGKPSQNDKEELRKAHKTQKLPLTLSMQDLPP
jgi:hypothetical protein